MGSVNDSTDDSLAGLNREVEVFELLSLKLGLHHLFDQAQLLLKSLRAGNTSEVEEVVRSLLSTEVII